MLDNALEYAAAGWSVFPLRGKSPLGSCPQCRREPRCRGPESCGHELCHGHLDATTDAAQVRAWWTTRPNANIGAAIDRRLLVLDIDPRNGGNANDLRTVDRTVSCFSGRGDGGRHLYYQRPAGPLTSTRLPKGIDLKVNGFMVMPPSIHPDSRQPYLWHGDHPILPLPSHLLELVRARPTIPRPMVRRGSGRGLVAFVRRFPERGVQNALYWASCRAVEDGTMTDTLAAELVAAAVDMGEREHRAFATVESARSGRRTKVRA